MWHKHTAQVPAELLTTDTAYDPALPSLLLVHGAGGGAELFRAVLRGLDGRVNAAAVSLPGHGQTAGPALPEVAGYAAWLARFLAAGPVRPVLLGHSMGGAVSLSVALDQPALLRGLIMLDSGARLKVMPELLDGLRDAPAQTLKNMITLAYAPGTDQRTLELGAQQMAAAGFETVHGDFVACSRFDLRPRLGELRMPALIMAGDRDNLTPLKLSQELAQGINGAVLEVIEGAGHMAHIEQPRQVAQAVGEFMAGL